MEPAACGEQEPMSAYRTFPRVGSHGYRDWQQHPRADLAHLSGNLLTAANGRHFTDASYGSCQRTSNYVRVRTVQDRVGIIVIECRIGGFQGAPILLASFLMYGLRLANPSARVPFSPSGE
jgi:hypothetical protein